MSQNLWPFVWQFLKPYKRIVIIYVFLAVCAGFWGPFNSILIKYMINTLSSSQSENIALLSFPAVLLVLNFIIFDNVTWRLIGYLNYKFQPEIKNKIMRETFKFILNSSQQFFNNNLSGRISSQIITLADNIVRILYPISAIFIRSISYIIQY